MVGGFDQKVAPAGGGDPARRGDAGRAGADNDDVGRANGQRSRGDCGASRQSNT